MKRLLLPIFLASAALVVASCQQEAEVETASISGEAEFTATTASQDTKTTLDGYIVKWNAGDEISINGVTYTGVPDNFNQTWATFSKKSKADVSPRSPFKAYYPASLYQAATPVAGAMTILPEEQKYGDFSINPMYAESKNHVLVFNNICAVLAVKLTSEDMAQIKSIRVSDKSHGMCGEFTVEPTETGFRAMLTDKQALTPVVLSCGEAVELSEDTTVFHIAIPEQEYDSLKIEISADGSRYSKWMTAKKKADIKANHIYPIDFVCDFPEGAVPGVFSVSPTKKVHFAKGNLQATKKSDGAVTANGDNNSKWDLGFATNQYDYIGGANISRGAFGDVIDLFGWSSNEEGKYLYGISTSAVPSDYGRSVDVSSFNDWGRIVTLPGNTESSWIWRSLTKAEWTYLINIEGRSGRTDAYRFAESTVNGVKGLILFPDNYIHPGGPAQPKNVNGENYSVSFTDNSYSSDDWKVMEVAGCVFLPCAGYRLSANFLVDMGIYWSSTPDNNADNAFRLNFYPSRVNTENPSARYIGAAIRLVSDIQ